MLSSTRRQLVLSLALAVGVSACDLDLTELNENPNAPADVPASTILPGGIASAVSLALGYNLNMDLTELWVQHLAEIQYGEEDQYELRSEEVDASFRSFYSGPLADFQRIIEKGQETEEPNVEAVGKIMKAWTFLIMTDMWGDLPYSQALTGAEEGGTIQPEYDLQEDIYAALLTELSEAGALIDPDAGCPFGAADLIYACDLEKWERFANSLRLRIGVRLSEVNPGLGQQVVQDAIAAGVFASNADNATLAYLPSLPNVNPWYNSIRLRPGDHRVSATVIDTLKSLDDPRLQVYANPTAASGEYRGMPNGLEEHSYQLDETSTIGRSFAAADAPAVLMSYSEVLFLLAEAAQRGWIGGGAAAAAVHYRDAIRASMEMWGVPNGQIQNYLLQPEVQYDPNNWRASIGLQKWIALFGNGPEAFAEWRRLGFPVLTPGADAAFDAPPRRYPYPDSEFVYNEQNLNMAITRQGGAALPDPVWWDVP